MLLISGYRTVRKKSKNMLDMGFKHIPPTCPDSRVVDGCERLSTYHSVSRGRRCDQPTCEECKKSKFINTRRSELRKGLLAQYNRIINVKSVVFESWKDVS